MQRQRFGVVAHFPFFEQPGLEGEIGVPAHEIFVAVARDIGHFDAVEGARILEALDVHGDAQHAALLRLGGAGGRRGDAAQRKSAGGADAEAGHQRQIFAAADAARPEIVGDRFGARVKFAVGQHEFHHRSLFCWCMPKIAQRFWDDGMHGNRLAPADKPTRRGCDRRGAIA